MIDGLSHLLTMRKNGLRPSSVILTIDGSYLKPVYEREFACMDLTAHGSVELDDFRAFKGLPVTLIAGEWSELAGACLEKLKLYADEITVLISAWGEDLGYFWSKEYGTVDFDAYPWVLKFHRARKSVCRTDEQQKKRLAVEAECLRRVPNLMEYRNGANPAS